jgi:uncharacterized membrane protein YjdF
MSKHTRSKPQAVTLDDIIQYRILSVLRLSVIVAMGLSLYYREFWPFLYSVLTFVLMYLPWLIRSKVNIKLPIEFDVVLAIFMYMAVFLGKAGNAYEHFWWWDVALHTSSGFIIGFVAFLILFIKVQQRKLQASPRLIGLLIFSVGLAFGAVWEIFEYGLALVFGGNLTAAGLRDTIQDLIVDGVGALVMAWVGVRQIFKPGKGFLIRWAENFTRINSFGRRPGRDT